MYDGTDVKNGMHRLLLSSLFMAAYDRPVACPAICTAFSKSLYFCFFRRVKHGHWGNKEFLQLCKIRESDMPPVILIRRKKKIPDTIQ